MPKAFSAEITVLVGRRTLPCSQCGQQAILPKLLMSGNVLPVSGNVCEIQA